ncbi:MAG: hypothetical protein ACO3N4_11120 [Ilumatobacteraceae bacterium]
MRLSKDQVKQTVEWRQRYDEAIGLRAKAEVMTEAALALGIAPSGLSFRWYKMGLTRPAGFIAAQVELLIHEHPYAHDRELAQMMTDKFRVHVGVTTVQGARARLGIASGSTRRRWLLTREVREYLADYPGMSARVITDCIKADGDIPFNFSRTLVGSIMREEREREAS